MGEIREAGDGCNLCECVMNLEMGPEWLCGTEPCGGGTWQGQLCKWDVSCPDWAVDSLCEDVTGVARPYELQIFVIGGDAAGPISLTLESLRVLTCD